MLREVGLLFRQAATGPYIDFASITKTKNKKNPCPGKHGTWKGAGLHKQITG